MIIYRKFENTLVGSAYGKPFSAVKTEENIKILDGLIADKVSQERIFEFVKSTRNTCIAGSNKYLLFDPLTNNYYLKYGNLKSTHAIPEVLVKYIEDSFDKDIDFMPVIKTWARLLSNPRISEDMIDYFSMYIEKEFTDYTAAEELEKDEGYSEREARNICTYPDIAITQEGLLATYKVAKMVTWEYIMIENEDGVWEKIKNPKYKMIPAVLDGVTGEVLETAYQQLPEFKEDILFTPAIHTSGDKFYSGDKIGYVYEVGKVQRLPRKALRNLKNTFGGGGLYCGGNLYIASYKTPERETLTCFVNPGDILSFQSEGSAIRVDALMPNNVLVEGTELKGMYHSSDYAEISGKRLDKLIRDALKYNTENFIEHQDEISRTYKD